MMNVSSSCTKVVFMLRFMLFLIFICLRVALPSQFNVLSACDWRGFCSAANAEDKGRRGPQRRGVCVCVGGAMWTVCVGETCARNQFLQVLPNERVMGGWRSRLNPVIHSFIHTTITSDIIWSSSVLLFSTFISSPSQFPPRPLYLPIRCSRWQCSSTTTWCWWLEKTSRADVMFFRVPCSCGSCGSRTVSQHSDASFVSVIRFVTLSPNSSTLNRTWQIFHDFFSYIFFFFYTSYFHERLTVQYQWTKKKIQHLNTQWQDDTCTCVFRGV